MPITSTIQPQVSNAAMPFDRLALRCMLRVTIENNQLVYGGTMSLHGTRYRKPNPGEFELYGMVGHGEVAASLNVGDTSDGDALMLTVANIARENIEVIGDCSVMLAFSWRVENGDLIGMATETITPIVGDPIQDSCGNVNERMATDPVFASYYIRVLQTISTWTTSRGW